MEKSILWADFGAKIQTRNCRFLKCEFRFREVENGRIFKIFVDGALVKIMRKFMCELHD